MGTRPLAVIAEHLDPLCTAWLAERCEVRCLTPHAQVGPRDFADAQALIVRTYTRVDRSLLAEAPALRVVGRAGVGLDNIDLGACAERAVRVVFTPDANTQAVAEYVSGLVLDDLRPRPTIGRAIGAGDWKALRAASIAPTQLSDLTLGILGMGRVGRRVARCLGGFGARILYTDLLDIPEADRHGAEPVSFDRLCAESDILTVHVDEREGNRGLVGRDALARCRPGVLIVNASRGMVVDPSALASFLRAHGGAGARAVLDVHEPEPPPAGHPLVGLANCRLLPHLGAATAPAHRNMSWVVRDVWRVLSAEAPEHEAKPRAL